MHLYLLGKVAFKHDCKTAAFVLLAALLALRVACISDNGNGLIITTSGPVSGILLDAGDSTAVADAAVSIAGDSAAVLTDSSGRFVLDCVPSGALFLRIHKERYFTAFIPIDLLPAQSLALDSPVYLQRNYRTIMGTILLADSLTPAAVAHICIQPASDTTRTNIIADSGGSFLATHVPRDTAGYTVRIEAPGMQPARYTIAATGSDTVRIVYSLRNYITLAGTVVRADSLLPLRNAAVWLDTTVVTTDSLGFFAIGHLISSDTGYLLSLSADGFEIAQFRYPAGVRDTLHATIPLKRSTGSLHGYVRLQGRRTHENAIIHLGPGVFIDTTDTAGLFRFDSIPTGAYIISMTATGQRTDSSTATVWAHDTTMVEFDSRIVSGTIHTRVDWTVSMPDEQSNSIDSLFTVYDTLAIAEGGTLYVHPGAALRLHAQAVLHVLEGGALRMHGERDSLVTVGPAAPGAAGGKVIIAQPGAQTPVLQYCLLRNTAVELALGPYIRNTLFVSMHDTATAPLLTMQYTRYSGQIEYCDFIRVHSKRKSILLTDGNGNATTAISKCIFYQESDSATCTPFLTYRAGADSLYTTISNSSFFSTCTLPHPLLSHAKTDTAMLYRFDPIYADIAASDFFLAPASPLQDKSSSGGALGALGPKIAE